MQDEAGPAVVLGGAGDEVADEGGAQGAASVDDQDGAVAGGAQQVAKRAIVLVAGGGPDGADEAAVGAELAELHVADAQIGAVPVDEVGGGDGG
ncbi:Hypothetical Protein sle_17210 [Streptomyces leeuwenhoekii]|uniref:Uncharacterized protein n=1 Tax=Streptomyces leeuwenhoekii TaxID=1437453 RepID=A0A0F7VRF7_STRLW|nr:hypothetical protein ACH49_07985 [Streptomyces leeuwenhoekii]CQR61183.1 Hypothetical Protein sle_17210 [Streptomyces leeuwenhoekii]